MNTLEEVLRRENPNYIGVVFDPKGGTFRHKLYPAYKAQREETPEDIRFAIPYIKSIIEGYRIPVIEVENYEADDVIGTLAKRFAVLIPPVFEPFKTLMGIQSHIVICS